MRVVLVSRYPRVDTPSWKRRVAAGLEAAGMDVAVLYSRAALVDQARAGLREEGLGVVGRYARLRRGGEGAGARGAGGPDGAAPMSLAAWARERGHTVVTARRLDDPGLVRTMEPDLLVLVGADLVPAPVLAVPRLGTINAHYGLLPAYRGMNVTEWSVYRGDPVGVSVHLVDEGVDTGPVLLREEIPLTPGETFPTLRRKHQDVAARLLVQAAVALRDGTAEPVVQAPADGRQYYRMHPALRRVAAERLARQASATG